MAVKVLQGGDGMTEIKKLTLDNLNSLISDGSLTATDYNLVLEGGLTEFRKTMNDNFTQFRVDLATTAAVKAQGSLTVDTQVTADDTMTVGVITYTFVASGAVANQINIGGDLATTQANIVAAINGTDGINEPNVLVTAADFSTNVSVITAILAGTAGNSIATTETFTAVTNVFDAATLGTTTAGVDQVDAGDLASTIGLIGGTSWSKIRSQMNTNFGYVDAVVNP